MSDIQSCQESEKNKLNYKYILSQMQLSQCALAMEHKYDLKFRAPLFFFHGHNT